MRKKDVENMEKPARRRFNPSRFLVICILVAAIVFCVWFSIHISSKESGSTIITEEKKITSITISSGIEDMGRLITAEYYYTHMEYYEESKKAWGFTIPFSTKSFILKCTGVVNAGVDFTEVRVDVDDVLKTITVYLPNAEVYDNYVDTDSVELCDVDEALFNKIEASDATDLLDEINDAELLAALDKGVLETAEKNAEDIVESFVRSLIDDDEYGIIVSFTDDTDEEETKE